MEKTVLVPVLLFLLLGICPLALGGAFFWTAGQNSLLSCTRLETTHINCQIERKFLGRIPSETLTIEKVTGTELNTSCDGDGCTYAVYLLTAEEAIQLSSISTSDLAGAEAEKERFDSFLANPAELSMTYNSPPRWLGMVFSSLFVLLGGYVTFRGIKAFIKTQFGKKDS